RRTLDKPVLHQKTVVIDGKVAYCGGMDPTELDGDRWDTADHLTDDPRRSTRKDEKIPWHDVHVRLSGQVVDAVQANFVERWSESPSSPQQKDDFVRLESAPSTGQRG